MIDVLLGEPAHGWLPLTLNVDGVVLELDVSDVPVNPVEELCECLGLVFQGVEASVWWHLEPTWYQFHFAPTPREVVFSIWKSTSHQGAVTNVLQHTGDIGSVILPFYRAFKHFNSRIINEKHWPRTAPEKVSRLAEAVRAQKATTQAE